MGIRYATREDVKNALDAKETARNHAQIDRAIESASRAVEKLTGRTFYPTTATRVIEWEDLDSVDLWLDENELLSVTSISVDGTATTAYTLHPRNETPRDRIEFDGVSGEEVTIVGEFGYCNDTDAAGALAEALDASETGVDITDSSLIDVGSLILVDTEWMNVTRRSMLDTTQDITADMTASVASVSVGVANGALFFAGETIQIGSEKMLIVEVTGNTLTVKRAWDGSTLASHTTGASVYAPRTLTVERGALGTTAATHLISASIGVLAVPALVRSYVIARSVAQVARESGGMTSDASKVSKALDELRDEVEVMYRRLRVGAV